MFSIEHRRMYELVCSFIHTKQPSQKSIRGCENKVGVENVSVCWVCFLPSYHMDYEIMTEFQWRKYSYNKYNINIVWVVWFGLFGDTYKRLTWPWSVHPRTPKPRANNPLKQKRSCNNPRRLTAHLSSSATIKILLIMFSLYHIQTLQEYKVNIILL